MKILGLTIIVVLFISTCNQQNTEDFPIDYGYDYYPLAIGQTSVYQVDSVIFSRGMDGIIKDSSTTFVKEEITDTLQESNGNMAYRLERFERKSDTLPWTIKAVNLLTIADEEAIRVEDNLRFVKMRFPVSIDAEWEGNPYFDEFITVQVGGESIQMFKSWEFEVLDKDAPDDIEGNNFDEVLSIQLANSENAIELRQASEKYAKGIGLVYKQLDILNAQCGGDLTACDTLSWDDKAERGFRLRQFLIEHY